MTFRIIESLTRKIKNLFGIHSPSRIFSGPPEDINAIPEIAPCPQCGEVPKISYACGEYFIFSQSKSRHTCFCSDFLEMHSSIEWEIKAWNRAVSNYAADDEDD